MRWIGGSGKVRMDEPTTSKMKKMLDDGVSDDYLINADDESLTFDERQQKKAALKKKAAEEDKKARAKRMEEDEKRKREQKSVVRFEHNVDFGSILVIGVVFFITCLSGLASGVSQPGIALRAAVSVAITSVIVFICRQAVRRYLHPDVLSKKAEKDEDESETDESAEVEGTVNGEQETVDREQETMNN